MVAQCVFSSLRLQGQHYLEGFFQTEGWALPPEFLIQ